MRQLENDFLHSMRYHVTVDTEAAQDILSPGEVQAGFSAVSTPELSSEAAEYKEGLDVYTRKYPGNPTVSDVTLSRGVTWRDTTFYDWMRKVVEGKGAYRATVTIDHFHRIGFLNRNEGDEAPYSALKLEAASPAVQYILYNAFPIRDKVAADLDATSSEVSVEEMDVAYEFFDVKKTEPA